MEEYFDVLNNKGDYTGKIESREKCHKEGLWHKAVAVFVINSKGQVLLQRRSKNRRNKGSSKWNKRRKVGIISNRNCIWDRR